ncbi:pimeloyl-ACP methyl ester carboxylesterase [Nitrobacteraceae bacterium AZCC 2161]
MHELISIPSSNYALDGLLYTPDRDEAVGSVIIFHGNCKNFYSGPSRFLAEPLRQAGFAVLTFNRRGHDVMYTQGRDAFGGAFQLAHEMIEDNDLAAQWMGQRGYASPAIIGHSNGGMLAVPHVAARPDTPALVLLSAHRGGRNLVPMISKGGLFAKDQVAELTEQARTMIAEGRGRDLMLLPGWWHVAAADTFVDFSTLLPDMMKFAPQISCPTLFIRGDMENRDIYPAEEFSEHSSGSTVVEIWDNCDHFYTGHEARVADRVASWLRENGRSKM